MGTAEGADVVVGGEAESEGLGGGAVVDVDTVGVVEVVNDVDGWDVSDMERVVVLGATILRLFFIDVDIPAAVPVAVVVFAVTKEGVQPSKSGWCKVAFADLDADGMYSGLGFQSNE
jgi:hypothetical protein